MANTSILAAFERMWQHIVTALAKKSDVGHIHSDATQSTSGFLSAEDKTQLDNGGIPIVSATSSDGVTYTATVDGISALTVGMKITIIPSMNSTNVNVKLNLNGLGDKYIRMPVAYNSTATSAGALTSWIGKNKPITLEYDGSYFKTISMPRQSALYLFGTVPVTGGGTGADNENTARTNLGFGKVLAETDGYGELDTDELSNYTLVAVLSTDEKPFTIFCWKQEDGSFDGACRYSGSVILYASVTSGELPPESGRSGYYVNSLVTDGDMIQSVSKIIGIF